jgi:hypothetical protein
MGSQQVPRQTFPAAARFWPSRPSPVQGEITEKPIEERKHRPVSGVLPYLVKYPISRRSARSKSDVVCCGRKNLHQEDW